MSLYGFLLMLLVPFGSCRIHYYAKIASLIENIVKWNGRSIKTHQYFIDRDFCQSDDYHQFYVDIANMAQKSENAVLPRTVWLLDQRTTDIRDSRYNKDRKDNIVRSYKELHDFAFDKLARDNVIFFMLKNGNAGAKSDAITSNVRNITLMLPPDSIKVIFVYTGNTFIEHFQKKTLIHLNFPSVPRNNVLFSIYFQILPTAAQKPP